jgi:citrate synthase
MSTESNPNPVRAKAGLDGVIAADTAISDVDGTNGKLIYHGYQIEDLAENASFAEVAYLLWYGRLPGKAEYEAFLDSFTGSMDLPIETIMILRMFPKHATPMEVLRTGVSSLGHWDPDSGVTRRDAVLRKAIRLTTRIPMLVTANSRIRSGHEPIHPVAGKSIAFNFLYCLTGEEPDEASVRAFDVALILHADHGFNASTFAARVTAATMSDMYSSVVSGIGALKGPLHGGANEDVSRMLEEIAEPERAEAYVMERLARKDKIPGFGHRVYKTVDPRANVLRKFCEKLSQQAGNTRWLDISKEVERVMRANTRVYHNVDFYSASCYRLMGIPQELFTPIFVCSRVVGWTAHILEQWANNRLIRPMSNYIGPLDLQYVPMDERT